MGYDILPGEHPIVPIMLGDAALASRMADALLKKGVYVIGFSYPVVPHGKRAFARRFPPRTRTRTWTSPWRNSPKSAGKSVDRSGLLTDFHDQPRSLDLHEPPVGRDPERVLDRLHKTLETLDVLAGDRRLLDSLDLEGQRNHGHRRGMERTNVDLLVFFQIQLRADQGEGRQQVVVKAVRSLFDGDLARHFGRTCDLDFDCGWRELAVPRLLAPFTS